MPSGESKEIKIGAFLSYTQTVVSMVISLVYTPVMLGLLGKTEYGLYNIAAATVSYVNLLNMGFSSSYVRFYSRYKANCDENGMAKNNGLFCIVFGVIGVLALVAGFFLCACTNLIFGEGLTNSEYVIVKQIMGILTISTAYTLATSIFSSIIIAHEKFVYHKTVNLIKTILSPSLSWMVLLLGYKSVMMAIIIASLTIIANTFYVIFCFTKLNVKIDFHSPDKHVLKEISAFSGFIALSAIADQINWSVDKILLGRYWGPAVTAVYSVSSTIQSLYMQISTAISNVFIPRVNRMVSEGESNETLTALFIRIGRFQMLVLLPILLGFIFLGKRFISVWCPTGYDEAYPIAMMLMIPSTLPYLQNIGIAIQTAQNRHKFRSVLYILMATVNFALSIPLCKLYGGVGCAVGTAISLIIANGLVMNIYYHKIIRLNVVKYWSSMLSFMPTVIASTGLGLTMNYFLNIDSWLKLFVCIGMFCIVYILMVWFTAMNREEKKSVLSMMNRRER